MPQPIKVAGDFLDLQNRWIESHTVAASPATNAETTICTFTINSDVIVTKGIFLEGWAAFTVGTSGVSANLKIRQTNTSGTTIAATGACTVAATNLVAFSVNGLDTAAVLPGQVYVLTLTIGSGAATSTVSACQLVAIVV